MCVALREGKEAIFGSCVLQNRFADLVLIFQKVKEHLIMRIIIKALFRGMNCWQQFSNVWGFCFVFLEMVSCGPDWLQICSVPQDDLEFMILLPSPSKYWDYRHIPTCLVVGIICGKI